MFQKMWFNGIVRIGNLANLTHRRKNMDVNTILAMLNDEQKSILAKELGVKAKAPRKEKVIVAQRIQLTDTAPTARRQRKAGEVTDLTEKALIATLDTWVRGKDADTLKPIMLQNILNGHAQDFKTFKLQGIKQDA